MLRFLCYALLLSTSIDNIFGMEKQKVSKQQKTLEERFNAIPQVLQKCKGLSKEMTENVETIEKIYQSKEMDSFNVSRIKGLLQKIQTEANSNFVGILKDNDKKFNFLLVDLRNALTNIEEMLKLKKQEDNRAIHNLYEKAVERDNQSFQNKQQYPVQNYNPDNQNSLQSSNKAYTDDQLSERDDLSSIASEDDLNDRLSTDDSAREKNQQAKKFVKKIPETGYAAREKARREARNKK